jgi:hypothetical protein
MATQVTLNSGSVDSAGSLALKTNGTTTAITINSSQGVEFLAGTAALPAITTTGDTNTGIFFPAADTIAFAEGGVEAMRIDSSGNLGVGTTSPGVFGVSSKNITVANSSGYPYLQLQGSSGNGGAIDFGDTSVRHAEIASLSGSALAFYTNGSNSGNTITERGRFDSSGNFLVGTTSGGNSTVQKSVTENAGEGVFTISSQTGFNVIVLGTTGTGYSVANTTMFVKKDTGTNRSINAAGTINASGADYAEYMTKAGNFTVAKGDVVGINAQGKLTNLFADAVSFMVKSTDPSYVGGDSWGSEEAIGLSMPEKPSQRQATEEVEAETDEAFAIRQTQYEDDKTTFNAALEVARQRVDRIAFAGQVPVNVTGATAGQYIIPMNDNGAIKGEAVSNPTFEQYQVAVGKVIAIESDGRARIIVKVA